MRRLRIALRSLWIVLFMLAVSVRYAWGRAGTFMIRDRERRRAALAHLRGRVLRWSMAHLGATFIKLGQVMSSRPDLFEPELVDELRQLQDKLPPFSASRARAAVEVELGRSLDECFARFDDQPVAAASVAQVHRAETRDGAVVAVKVLRPDVRAKVERDAAVLLLGARVAALHPRWRLSDPVGHLEHFVAGILDQTDLALEAEHLRRFSENFASFDGVRFPRVYEALSGRRVLTMEFVEGVKVDALEGAAQYSGIGLRLQNMFLKMCFADGYLHADLHPGNLVVTPDGEVVVFDCGLVKVIGEELLDEFLDFNRCIAIGDGDDFVNHLRRFHEYLDGVDWDALAADCLAFATTFRGKPQAELETSEIINQILALGRRYGVRPRTEMALVMVGFVTAEGIGKMLEPDMDTMKAMADFLIPIVQRRQERRRAAPGYSITEPLTRGGPSASTKMPG